MRPELYILWVDTARRIVSLSFNAGFEKIVFKNEQLFTDAFLSFLGKGYNVI